MPIGGHHASASSGLGKNGHDAAPSKLDLMAEAQSGNDQGKTTEDPFIDDVFGNSPRVRVSIGWDPKNPNRR